jgi:hypothetical protein
LFVYYNLIWFIFNRNLNYPYNGDENSCFVTFQNKQGYNNALKANGEVLFYLFLINDWYKFCRPFLML